MDSSHTIIVTNLDQADDDILNATVSDDALEAAADREKQLLLSIITGNCGSWCD
jgi:hypothetical protein